MKRKTAIEECIEREPKNWDSTEDARDLKAIAELRALLALAKLTAFAQGHLYCAVDWDAHNAQVDRKLGSLRRLGVLPEVKP